jgi:hypothetical protein
MAGSGNGFVMAGIEQQHEVAPPRTRQRERSGSFKVPLHGMHSDADGTDSSFERSFGGTGFLRHISTS